MMDDVSIREVRKRRTFAIISHPDAGKTTLTEKLLLFGGAIQLAGTVKGRKATRHATSDWMRLEQERGISITSSVMQFPYGDALINLLDTPGHEDFSEDTYRTLTAVDSALMVIDAAKGVEARTIKLMEVCRLRTTPIISFINKLDRDGRPPIELLDDIETVLDIACTPLTWPIGMGREFRGIYDLREDCAHLYQNRDGSRLPEVRQVRGLASAELASAIGESAAAELREAVELVRGATPEFDHAAYLAGRQTPVFFGAAIHNYGVRELLDAFVEARAAAATARDQRADRRARREPVQRVRVQDSGEHGSRASRPNRVLARVLGRLSARDAHVPHALASARSVSATRSRSWRPTASTSSRRTRATSSACTITARSTSATASRRASRSCSRAFRASRRSCSAAPCCAIR